MNQKILAVDDDDLGRMLLRRVLRSDPECDVVEARDGLAAWEMLQEGLLPTLITLDIMMPRMDGLDLLARVLMPTRLQTPLRIPAVKQRV